MPAARQYSHCGLVVSSEIALPWFDAGETARCADVRVRRGAIPARPADLEQLATASFEGDAFRLSVQDVGRFLVRHGNEVIVDSDQTAPGDDLRLYLCGAVFGAVWHQRGVLALHASAVRVGEHCVLFAGRSGAGKSTLAAHLAGRGHDLIADDVSVISTVDEQVAVWPTVPHLKLDARSLETLGEAAERLPWAGGSRGKRRLMVRGFREAPDRPVRCCRFYLLDKGDGALRIEPMTGLDALDAVAGHTYWVQLADGFGYQARWLRLAATVAARLEVRRLVRPWGLDVVDTVVSAVLADFQDAATLTEPMR